MKVFLGGTVNGSRWRDLLISKLEVEYFNPVVENWDDEAYKRELYERKNCDFCLYVITARMTGYYSLAEVIDDSFKKTDKTIYCFLEDDDGEKFSESEIEQLNYLGKIVKSNGAVWFYTLDEVANFLNSANKRQKNEEESKRFNEVFISYGRRHSLAFARRLYKRFNDMNYNVWFDMNDIPLGVDFQEQIDEGIKRADNFVFIISPHSVKSVYCLKEVVLALKYNKRIIPILHVEPSDCWDKLHPVIAKLNWVYCRQKEDFSIPLEEWKDNDDFEKSFSGLVELIEIQMNYIREQTVLLYKAIEWEKVQKAQKHLLYNNERIEAFKWLTTKVFYNNQNKEIQPPCIPTDLHSEFIAESIKNSRFGMTDVYISHSSGDDEPRTKIMNALAANGITFWSHKFDMIKGLSFEDSLRRGIELSDNVVFIFSDTMFDEQNWKIELEHAQKLNKRIITVLIEKLSPVEIPEQIRNYQPIDFTDLTDKIEVKIESHADVEADVNARKGKAPFYKSMDLLLSELDENKSYYRTHKELLVDAINWKQRNVPSLLLYNYKLESARTWITIAEQQIHKPTDLHREFITASQEVTEYQLDVFIAHETCDDDFARFLNQQLKDAGKITWFDRENMPGGVNIKQEINQYIEQANAVLFVISTEALQKTEFQEHIHTAVELGKRIIVAFSRETNEELLPKRLFDSQRIDFVQRDFQSGFNELLRSLDVDRAYLSAHTKWNQLAKEWERGNKNRDLLLKGSEMHKSVQWLHDAYTGDDDAILVKDIVKHKLTKQPSPSKIQIEYIEESQKSYFRTKRTEKIMNIAIKSSLVVAVIFLIVAIYATFSANKLRQKAKTAEHHATVLFLASKAQNMYDTDPTKAIRIAQNAFFKDSMNPAAMQALTDCFYRPYNDNRPFYYYSIDGHSLKVNAANFSPDSKLLVTCSEDSTAKVWDLNGKLQFVLKGHQEIVLHACFSPDGELIATASLDGTACLWDKKGKKRIELKHHNAPVSYISFSHDGKRIYTASFDNTVKVSDLNGNLQKTYNFYKKRLLSVETSLDDKMLVVAADAEMVFVHDTASRKPVVIKLSGKAWAASFAPNATNNILTACENNIAELWTVKGKLITTYKGHASGVVSAKFTPNGNEIITSSVDGTTKIWNIDGTLTNTLYGHEMEVFYATVSPDNKYIATASADGTVKLWFANTEDRTHTKLVKHISHSTDNAYINSAFYSPDNKYIVTSSGDNTARIWDNNGKELVILQHPDIVLYAIFSNKGDVVLTSCTDGNIRIWDLTGKLQKEFQTNSVASSISINDSDDKIVVACEDKTAKIWDRNGKLIQTLTGHTAEVYDALYTHDGTKILTSSNDKTVIMWDSKTGKQILTLKGHTWGVNSIDVSSDDKYILTASLDRSSKLWTIDGKLIATLEGHKGSHTSAEFSTDDKYIFTASGDNTFNIWLNPVFSNTNADHFHPLAKYTGHTNTIYTVDLSPDGRTILTASWDGKARIWMTPQVIYEWLNSSDCLLPQLSKADNEELKIKEE